MLEYSGMSCGMVGCCIEGLTVIHEIRVDNLFMRDANAKGQGRSWLNNPGHVTRLSTLRDA
jgi:hypothetical protein